MNEGGCGGLSIRREGSTRGGGPKVLLIQLMNEELVRTDGTTALAGKIFDHPQLRALGPQISRMRAWWHAEGAAATFTGQVLLSWSVTGRGYTAPVDITSGGVAGGTQTPTPWYSNDANFGPFLRVQVSWANTGAGAALTATLTVWLEVELKS